MKVDIVEFSLRLIGRKFERKTNLFSSVLSIFYPFFVKIAFFKLSNVFPMPVHSQS